MHGVMLTIFAVVQVLFLFSLLVTLWFLAQKVNLIPPRRKAGGTGSKPPIIMFYPVLNELEETMRLTSICGLGQVALAAVLAVLRMQRDDAPPPPAAGGRDGPPRG